MGSCGLGVMLPECDQYRQTLPHAMRRTRRATGWAHDWTGGVTYSRGAYSAGWRGPGSV